MNHETLLITRARNGDEVAFQRLVDRYAPLINFHLRGRHLCGGDEDDLRQEALIGLCEAVRDFKPGASSFATFASLCIQRNLVNAWATSSSQKQRPLNEARSLSEPLSGADGGELTLGDTASTEPSPDEILEREVLDLGVNLQGHLSAFELGVLMHRAEGLTYEQIADEVDADSVAVRHALERARGKLRGLVIGA